MRQSLSTSCNSAPWRVKKSSQKIRNPNKQHGSERGKKVLIVRKIRYISAVWVKDNEAGAFFCKSFERIFVLPTKSTRAKDGSLTALKSLHTRDIDSISPTGDGKIIQQDEPAGSRTFSPHQVQFDGRYAVFITKSSSPTDPQMKKSLPILVKGNPVHCSLVCCCQNQNVGHLFCAQTGAILA